MRALDTLFSESSRPLTWCESIKLYFSYNMENSSHILKSQIFGSFDYMRSDIIQKYQGQ